GHESLASGARAGPPQRPELLHSGRHPRARDAGARASGATRLSRRRLRPLARRGRIRAPRDRGARPRAAVNEELPERLSGVSRSRAPGEEAPPQRGLRRLFKRWKPPRKLKLTREGKYFIGVTFGVGFAAINTGNNLLYLLLGMLLSLIIVSGVLSELSLRRLTVSRKLPPRAQVGRPHLVEIEVFNHKRRSPSYAI